MYCRVVVAALLLMVSAVASAAASEIVEGQRGRSQGFVGDYSNTALTKRVVPRASESLAENEVVLQSYFVRKDNSDSDGYVFVGMLLNNTIAGVYDVEVTLYFPVEGGYENIEDHSSVYGTPAYIFTKDRLHGLSRHQDYIPPGKIGYFSEYTTLQDNYDFSKVRYEVEWTWTLQASIDTSVRVLPQSVKIEPHEYADRNGYYKDRKTISGTLINGLAVPIELRYMGVIALSKANKQARVTYSFGNPGIYGKVLAPNQTINFVSSHIATNVDMELLFVPSYGVPDTFVYPASYSDKAYISSTISAVDAARIDALKMGDLNEDGVINVADFLIFTDNFGKTIGTD